MPHDLAVVLRASYCECVPADQFQWEQQESQLGGSLHVAATQKNSQTAKNLTRSEAKPHAQS